MPDAVLSTKTPSGFSNFGSSLIKSVNSDLGNQVSVLSDCHDVINNAAPVLHA